MRLAVTGASGFIGRHLQRELIARGHQVTAISRHPLPSVAPGLTQISLDIGDVGADGFDRIGRPDILVHLAWGGLPNYRSDLHLDHELPRQLRFLDACLESGLQRLIVSGTCLEYGMHGGELDEHLIPAPTTAYASAKARLYTHLMQRRAQLGFGLGWLRLFYLYGDGQAASSLYTQLRTAVSTGAERFAMSAGDQIRDFLAIEHAVARMATLALDYADAGIVNLCSGRPTTVVTRVRSWLQEWNADIILERGVYPYPDYEPFAFWGSVRRMNALLEGR